MESTDTGEFHKAIASQHITQRNHASSPIADDISTRLPTLLLEAWIFCLPLFCVAVLLKILLLRGGEDLRLYHLSLRLSYLRMFAGEVWESLVIVPALLILLGLVLSLMGRGFFAWRKWIYFIFTELLVFVAVVHWATYRILGQFPTTGLVSDFFTTVKTNPAFLSPSNLLDKKAEFMFCAALLLGVLPILVAYFAVPRIRSVWLRHYKWSFAILAVTLFLAGTPPVSVTGQNFYRVGSLQRTVVEILKPKPPDEVFTADELRTSPKELYTRLVFPGAATTGPNTEDARSFTRVPKQTRPNVIFVVMETAGVKDYPLSGPDSKMPHVAALLPNSLIANNHYSTDIESMRSNFAIYTSLYDLPGEGKAQYFGKHLVDVPTRPLDALPRILAEQGYATRYYFPATLWPKVFEEASLHLYGFQKIEMVHDVPVVGDPADEDAQWQRSVVLSSPTEKMDAERKMYEMAIQDIGAFHAQRKPFFLAIVGGIGHSPFKDIRPPAEIAKSPNPPRAVLVGNIAAFQDQLIGDLIERLKQLNLLDNTILVVTGDHGPRDHFDDPNLDLSFANDENYHVPLLIHFPAAFQKPIYIDRLTSHLDLAPTVLDLMGFDPGSYMQEGLSMFNPAREDRVTYFLGQHLRGFDSLYYHGQFMMHSFKRNATYANSSFQFSGQNKVDVTSSGADTMQMQSALMGLRHVQEAWIQYLRNVPHQ